jgi:tetratricopeptide (TPR) repeat protein
MMIPARILPLLLLLPRVWAHSDVAASLERLAAAEREVREDKSRWNSAKLRQAEEDAATAAASPDVADKNEAHNLLGVIYLRLERPADGLRELMKVDLGGEAPNRPVYLFNIGRAYEMNGMWETAFDSYLQAIGTQSSFEVAANGLLRVSAQADPHKAMEACMALLVAGSTDSANRCFDRELPKWKEEPTPEAVFTFVMQRSASEREFQFPPGTPGTWREALDEIRDAMAADYPIDFTKAPKHDRAKPEAEFVRLLLARGAVFGGLAHTKSEDTLKNARRATASYAAAWALDSSKTDSARRAVDLLEEFQQIEDRKALIVNLARSVASRSDLPVKADRPDTWEAWSGLYTVVGNALGDGRTCRSADNPDDPLYYWLRALDAELHAKGTKPFPAVVPRPDVTKIRPSSSLVLNRHLADCYRDIGATELYHRFDDATKPMLRAERPFDPVKEKLEFHLRSMFYPGGIGKSVVQAGLLQVMNTPERWGQGWKPFGERFASSQGTRIIRQNIAFWLDTAFGQEPRYERSPYRSAGDRFKYSVSQTFICYSDRRTRQFAVWRVGSAVAAELISNVWRPRGTGYGDRKASSALLRSAADLGGDAGSNLLREFLPRRGKRWARFLRAFL